MNTISADQFSTHAPKSEWLDSFFSLKESFFEKNNLGPEQLVRFKKFLKFADLIDSNGLTYFNKILLNNKWDTPTSLQLLLINIASCPQIKWYIKNLPIGQTLLSSLNENTHNPETIQRYFLW